MNIIVISAHPDDEIIGCGGTLIKHRERGDNIAWIIVTKAFENQGFKKTWIRNRQKEIESVAKRLKINEVYQLDYPTMTLSSNSLVNLVPEIAKIFKHYQPNIVYVMNRSDAHSDHRVCFQATMTCTKSFRYPSIKKVLMYECISETEFAPAISSNQFLPNYFVDISKCFQEKIQLLNIYESEIGQHPFPRSNKNTEALAIFRGATAGVEYAEAFQTLLIIDK